MVEAETKKAKTEKVIQLPLSQAIALAYLYSQSSIGVCVRPFQDPEDFLEAFMARGFYEVLKVSPGTIPVELKTA